MTNPYYFTDRLLKIAIKFLLVSHNITHKNSTLCIKPIFIDIGIDKIYVNKI